MQYVIQVIEKMLLIMLILLDTYIVLFTEHLSSVLITFVKIDNKIYIFLW